MGLASSEGLGISARGWQRECIRVEDSASRSAPRQEQSRYSASGWAAKNLARRSAPSIADHQGGFLVLISGTRSRSVAWVHGLLGSVGSCEAGQLRAAAPSRCLRRQLPESGLVFASCQRWLNSLCRFPSTRFAIPRQHAAPRCHSRLCRVVAVQFTPTGALPAGVPQGGLSDA